MNDAISHVDCRANTIVPLPRCMGFRARLMTCAVKGRFFFFEDAARLGVQAKTPWLKRAVRGACQNPVDGPIEEKQVVVKVLPPSGYPSVVSSAPVG